MLVMKYQGIYIGIFLCIYEHWDKNSLMEHLKYSIFISYTEIYWIPPVYVRES